MVRASGSVAANGLEVLRDRDRVMTFRLCRKEATECQLWLRLLSPGQGGSAEAQRALPYHEAHQRKLTVSPIIRKLE